jgi:superfamily II DNA or RNA helicase
MPRTFNQRQRLHAYAMTDGLCALCGAPLDPDSFHADHVVPWVSGGETSADNVQPLCPLCNLKKGGNMLLSHQQRFQQICRDMKTSTALRGVLASVVCGGGKSIYPVIIASELIPVIADGLCWVSPRDNLRSQGEGNFMDPRIRSILGHQLEIRAAKNDADPMRDKVGYATTYQALSTALRLGNDNPHLKTFRNKRMILVLDEPQHCALNGAFHAAVEPLKKLAVVTVLFSGGLSRHDNQTIAYLNYLDRDKFGKRHVDLTDTPECRIIRYGLADATKERQLIEIKFELRDAGRAAWEIENDDGEITERAIDTFDGATSGDTSKGLFTALTTDFANDLLCEAGEFWMERRKANPRSKFLVVCTSISQANAACRLLRSRLGIAAEVVHTGDDDDEAAVTVAENAILRFRGKKRPEISALVTVQMAYEGLDCPATDVLACLTHIRSRQWIEQCIHRATRWDRDGLPWERQFATVFAPKDRFFRDIMKEMEEEQAPYVRDKVPPPPPPPPPTKNTFRPIESEMGAGSAYAFGGVPIEGDEHANLNAAMRAADLYGDWPIDKAKRFYEAMNNPAPSPAPEEKPPSERETDLRRDIENYKRSDYRPHDPASSAQIARRGGAIWRMFNKPVPELTEPQLHAVWNARHSWFNA